MFDQFSIRLKIVGRETAPIDTWGSAMFIIIDRKKLCGGSILSSTWVLTVAHRVQNITASQVKVYPSTNLLAYMGQWQLASVVIPHKNYDSIIFTNDIALIQVSPPFNMTDRRISKICLPISTRTGYPQINSTIWKISLKIHWIQQNYTFYVFMKTKNILQT
ncbi:unnamed protein product, partial [Rotaria magnacalcarata]